MPKCHKIYPNCIWYIPPEWHGLNFSSALLTKRYWKYATHIIHVCVCLPNPLLILAFSLRTRVITKLNVVLKLWLVCTAVSANILLHLRIHSLKNHSLTSLQGFTPKFSIITPTNTPRMMNQPILLTLPSLHFIHTTQLIFPDYFYIFLKFYATPRFLPQNGAPHDTKDRWPRTTSDRKGGPGALQLYKTAGRGEQL